MNKKIKLLLILVGIMFLFGGCSLAKDAVSSKNNAVCDAMIGAYITEEYPDTTEVGETISIEDGDFSVLYEDEKYFATIDKKGSESVADWEVCFEEIPGIACFAPSYRYGEEEYDVVEYTVIDDEVVVKKNHWHSEDNKESYQLDVLIYVEMVEGKEYLYHINPVYQTADGEIYMTSGDGYCIGGGSRDAGFADIKLNTSSEINVMGEKQTRETDITVNFKIMNKPNKIILHELDLEQQVVKSTEYEPDAIPEEIKGEKNTIYLLVETQRLDFDGNVIAQRDLKTADENGEIQFDTFYTGENGALIKQEITFINY